MLATGLIVAYGYLMETFMAWYSGNIYEQYMMWNRMFGPYWYMYWALILFNILVPQALWFPRVRTNPRGAVHHRHLREYRYVAGALRDRCRQPVA